MLFSIFSWILDNNIIKIGPLIYLAKKIRSHSNKQLDFLKLLASINPPWLVTDRQKKNLLANIFQLEFLAIVVMFKLTASFAGE